MVLAKERFKLYELDETKRRDIVSVPLNKKERILLEKDKEILQQEKDATAIKQLAAIGRYVIHGTPGGKFFRTVLDNLRKNKVLGIEEVEAKIEKM